MLTEDWIRRRWLEACDSTAITLGAFKTVARAIEAEIAAKAGKSPVGRVREHGDFQATIDWLLNPLPDGTELFDAPVACPKCDEWRESEHKLSEAYLRIRQKLNAFDTPHGPTADQVYAHTEVALDALRAKCDLLVIERDAQAVLISDQQAEVDRQTEISNNFAAQVRQQDETITGLRAEVDHRQSLLRESNRNCAEHAGVVWTQNVTIAQQAEQIAELEQKATRARSDADMYANAWQRELCAFDGKIYNKRHHIDAMVVTTQRFVEAWKQAIRALTSAGYTLNDGAQEWKPPVGPSASPLLDKIDAQSALIEKCRVGFLKVKHKKNDALLLDIIADAHLTAITAQKVGAE